MKIYFFYFKIQSKFCAQDMSNIEYRLLFLVFERLLNCNNVISLLTPSGFNIEYNRSNGHIHQERQERKSN